MDERNQHAAVLRELADIFTRLQDADSNDAGAVLQIQNAQLRSAETVLLALQNRWLEAETWAGRLWQLTHQQLEFAESLGKSKKETRTAFLSNMWRLVCGGSIATIRVTSDGNREATVVNRGALFPTPYAAPEIQAESLQRAGTDEARAFEVEAARHARLCSAFICRTFADAIEPRNDDPIPPDCEFTNEGYSNTQIQNALKALNRPYSKNSVTEFIAGQKGLGRLKRDGNKPCFLRMDLKEELGL